MKFNFMTVATHNELMAAKDKKIKELNTQLEESGKSANSKEAIAEITALFGDAAKEDGFDLKAAVSNLIAHANGVEADLATAQKSLETAEANLETATTALDAAAEVLGHTSAEGVDLAAEIAAIEPEGRTTPLDGKEKKAKAQTDESIECDVDLELKQMLKDSGIN